MLRHGGGHAVEVHGVFGGELVAAAEDEFEPVGGHANGFEEGCDYVFVVFGAELDEFDGRFERVEEAVDVGQEHFYRAPGLEEVREFDHRDEVAAMGPPGCGGSWKKGERMVRCLDELGGPMGWKSLPQ